MNVQELKPSDVLTVYSGRAGKCCCGCSGKHYVNPDYRAEAAEEQGYAVDDEDCSKGMITRVLNILRNAPIDQLDVSPNYVAFETDTRLSVAYLIKRNCSTSPAKEGAK